MPITHLEGKRKEHPNGSIKRVAQMPPSYSYLTGSSIGVYWGLADCGDHKAVIAAEADTTDRVNKTKGLLGF